MGGEGWRFQATFAALTRRPRSPEASPARLAGAGRVTRCLQGSPWRMRHVVVLKPRVEVGGIGQAGQCGGGAVTLQAPCSASRR
jgi:hypothetical protein